MIPEKAKSEIIKKRQEGETWTAIAEWMEETTGITVHRSTIQRWYDKEGDYVDGGDNSKLEKQVETYKTEAEHYKKLYEQASDEISTHQSIVDIIQTVTQPFKEQALVRVPSLQGRRGREPQSVVAPLADTHIGDNVDYNQMSSLNAYTIDIFNARLYGWASQILDLVEFRRAFADVPELVVPLLGDMVSGDIHQELRETNQDNTMGQMIRGANLIAQALMFMAPHFETVRVPCVVGNHGRMTQKPPAKDKYVNWDYMLYQWVAAFCREQSNIEFEIPKSFFHVFPVCNRNILIMHGDSLKGKAATGDVLRTLTNMRTVLQYRTGLEEEVSFGQDEDEGFNNASFFDSAFMGHYHRVDEFDIGTGEAHICGCMKGGDEYALNQLSVISKPKQLVTYWHPKYGYIGKEVVYLNRYDGSENKFNDSLPSVWITT